MSLWWRSSAPGAALLFLDDSAENHSRGLRRRYMDCGQLVLITLHNPREKFWGVLLSLTPAGVSVRGVDLESLDDFTQMVKAGDPASTSVVFFPMHRVQRMELDGRTGEFPSLAEQFTSKTGKRIETYFAEPKK